MPYFVEHFGRRYGITPKAGERTVTVGYCGYATFKDSVRKWRAFGKHILQRLMLWLRFDRHPSVHTRGIFWRHQAMQLLQAGGVPCRFIVRPFYSGHRMSVTRDAGDIRREYVENLRECDIALCVRGDANASQRFYEALSASRIPLFLDTDCVLPLEEVISYDDFMIRVPSREIADIAHRAQTWGVEGAATSFLEKGKKARQAFETHLRLDRYFTLVFDRGRSPYTRILFT